MQKQELTHNLYTVQIILSSTKIVEIFIACDDFLKGINEQIDSYCLNTFKAPQKRRKPKMNESEIMTVIIYYHFSGFRCFKWYYNKIIRGVFSSYFPTALSYNRFVQLMPRVNLYLTFFMAACRLSIPTEGNYIDSKKLIVSHNRRIQNHRVHKGVAARGKSSTGWFFGFKLHLIINHLGEIVLFVLSPGNVADNNQDLLLSISEKVKGFLFGDKGYLTKIIATLQENGLNLIARLRSNMRRKQNLTPEQKYYMKHRGLIETVFDILKHKLDIEHSRNRSTPNYFANVLGAIIAYTFLDKIPAIPTYQQKISKADFDNAQIEFI